jgi:subtilisin family serine protease
MACRAPKWPGLTTVPVIVLMSTGCILSGCSRERGSGMPSGPNLALAPTPSLLVDTVPNRYIIVFKPDPVLDVRARATGLTRSYNGELGRVYTRVLQGFSATLSREAIDSIRELPEIAFIEPVTRGGDATGSVQSPVGNWGLDRIDQLVLLYNNAFIRGWTGAGVHEYHIDSGIHYSDPEFGGRAILGKDFVTEGGDASDCDSIKAGHGTATAGIVGSSTFGVAKGVTLVSVKVVDCLDHVVDSDVLIDAFEWVTEHAILPAVANYSISGPYDPAKNIAVYNSIAAGITWVVAAGNLNEDSCDKSPGSVVPALTVGASMRNDRKLPLSNTGSCVDLYAPGDSIFTTSLITNQPTMNGGTSYATPFVTGAAALYLEAHPTATPAEVHSAIKSAAYPYIVWDVGNTTQRLLNIEAMFPNPFSLTVSITGKSSIKPDQYCTWHTSVQGGAGQLEYRWKFNNQDFDLFFATDSVRTMISITGTLGVEVTDSGGAYRGTASKSITVSSGGATCVT